MNRDRNPYPFHDMPRYDAERAARVAAAVARADAARAAARRRERLARLAVVAAVVAVAVAMFYAASEPAPLPSDVTRADWNAHNAAGDVIARGLTLADCVARFADCRIDNP